LKLLPRNLPRTLTVTTAALLILTALTSGTASAVDTIYFPNTYDPAHPFNGEDYQWETQVDGEWIGWGDDTGTTNTTAGNFTVEASEF